MNPVINDLFTPPDMHPGNVKLAMKEAGAVSSDLWKVPYPQFRAIPGFNVRERTPEYLAHIQSIKNSILANGFNASKPIEGYVAVEDGLQIIYITDGYTRHEAVGLAIAEGAPIEVLPTVVKPKGTNMEDLTVGLVTSNSGRPLTPMEISSVVKRLIGMGLEVKEISKRIGFTVAYLNDLLSLGAAPKAIRDMVRAGEVSATAAIKEVNTHGGKAVARLKQGLKTAQALGKTKLTPKHLPKEDRRVAVPSWPPTQASMAFEATVRGVFKDSTVNLHFPEGKTEGLERGDTLRITVVKKTEQVEQEEKSEEL